MPLSPENATPEEIARGLALLQKQRDRARDRYYKDHEKNKERQLQYYYANHEANKTRNREAARARAAAFKAMKQLAAVPAVADALANLPADPLRV